ncbi:MAG: hypothetical protein NWE98_09030 [Candidatus Bathyarchaeota archaeon]|nr:hypothetical protein [Candidatus Bathyarchaeota archaeon]
MMKVNQLAKHQNHNQSSTATQKISTYLTLIVLIVMALAVAALLLAITAYATDVVAAGVLAIIGLIALVLSGFMLYQFRRQTVQLKIEIPKVMTTIECTKCGGKTIREFQRGDYVYKELEPCQKCPETKQMITAIYKEVKEKEKTYEV